MLKYIMVGVGGFLGAMARFWVGGYIAGKMGARFPYGTFVINCSGCFFLGLVMTILSERTRWNTAWIYLVPIGFIGAYTTFSTFEFETLQAAQGSQITVAILNIVLSVLAGFIAVWLGVIAGRVLS